MTYDLISIGDSSLDVFLNPSESEALCELDDKDCLICFTYGEKIPVKTLEFSVGGNAANNAVGARRLGINTAIITSIGGDSSGNQIVERLKETGVDLTFLSQSTNETTNYSTVINYDGERTIFSYHTSRSYQVPETFPNSSWIYLTSMGDGFEAVYAKVVDRVKNNPEIKLAFNPGSYQFRAGAESLKKVLQVTYAVYINREEAQKITGMENSQGNEKDLLKSLASLGPKLCLVTDGGNGSYCFDGDSFYHSDVFPIDAYERTGAGDAFGSGCISALIKGKAIEEALLWGTLNSASVIGYVGSQRGLLSGETMNIWLERAKSCNLKISKF